MAGIVITLIPDILHSHTKGRLVMFCAGVRPPLRLEHTDLGHTPGLSHPACEALFFPGELSSESVISKYFQPTGFMPSLGARLASQVL